MTRRLIPGRIELIYSPAGTSTRAHPQFRGRFPISERPWRHLVRLSILTQRLLPEPLGERLPAPTATLPRAPPIAAVRHSSTSGQPGRSPSPPYLLVFSFRVFGVFRGYIGIHLCRSDELIQPPVGHHGVVDQQDKVVSPRDVQALIDRGGKAEVLCLAHDRHPRRGEILDASEINPRSARFNDGRFRVTTEAQLRARACFVFTATGRCGRGAWVRPR
jgi:hypothetical protein